ncbi:HEAT repeat domain-containing protein [Thermomonospora sp. CIF 1]|uniref:HEAT repeat domain-containing protein n=1 Tax=Thermomonospora sp. CIF 1 TaxID=1916083 RepID=UPI0025808B7E|nr:HEAT repeat domain-containing protein [Thermomonospora sp. CIF 1]
MSKDEQRPAARPFLRALEQLHSDDPRARERGFDFLREHADSYVAELIEAFGREDDAEMRCLLLELLAEARDPTALPVLAEQLACPDESVQFWAVRGLEMLGTREAGQALDRARAEGWIF